MKAGKIIFTADYASKYKVDTSWLALKITELLEKHWDNHALVMNASLEVTSDEITTP